MESRPQKKQVAELVTTDQVRILFDPGAISLVTAADIDTRAPTTTVYGLGNRLAHIREPGPAFPQRIGEGNNFASLTSPNDMRFWIRVSIVTSIGSPVPDGFQGRAFLTGGPIPLNTKESLDEARAALTSAGWLT